MRIDVLTLFPGILQDFLGESILGIARDKGLFEARVWNIRDYTDDKHRKVDDRPYGGGPGMVMMPGPICAAVAAAEAEAPQPARKILLTPQGRTFSQPMARELAREERLLLICGRYEGFDERIRRAVDAEELSIGDYVLAGGEVAAMAVVEAVVRLIPGVLGDPESASFESFEGDTLDFPQYTRPAVFRGMAVPDILLSGDHGRIRQWREAMAHQRTRTRRPDLARRAQQTPSTKGQPR